MTVSSVAAFSGAPTSGKVLLTVAFTDKSTETPTSWKWTFGDGTISTKQDPFYLLGFSFLFCSSFLFFLESSTLLTILFPFPEKLLPPSAIIVLLISIYLTEE
jgi:disulfide bond formation protein DsbB